MLSRKLSVIIAVSLVLLFIVFLGVLLLTKAGSSGMQVITERKADPEAMMKGGQENEQPYRVMPGDVININTADASELQRLPGIGAVLADAIVAWRTENGPFGKAEDLMKVPGIGADTFSAVSDYIVTGDS